MADHDHEDDPLHIHVEDHEETYYEKRIVAISNLLMDKGIITAEELLEVLRENEAVTPVLGARVVARAWVDPAFKERLLEDGKSALAEMGIQIKRIRNIKVVENTDDLHHVTVCTLCSCYPVPLLGPPPEWYKRETYRTWMVEDPRAALKDMGLELDEGVRLRVVDSTAEIRYLVLPQRPPGAEAMSEEELADLVTRDSMIGVAVVPPPTTTV